ncbi:hypothetical protein C8R43DRAFT_30673 [Mycena crocata]|nr:hypothetical protein C8R43DRAFT_30673 [Mycena crocata]
MQFLTIFLAAFLTSSSFSSVAALPELTDDKIVAMADGVLYARNFMERLAEEHSQVKRDCGYPVDVNNDGNMDTPDCTSSDVWHCNVCHSVQLPR